MKLTEANATKTQQAKNLLKPQKELLTPKANATKCNKTQLWLRNCSKKCNNHPFIIKGLLHYCIKATDKNTDII